MPFISGKPPEQKFITIEDDGTGITQEQASEIMKLVQEYDDAVGDFARAVQEYDDAVGDFARAFAYNSLLVLATLLYGREELCGDSSRVRKQHDPRPDQRGAAAG